MLFLTFILRSLSTLGSLGMCREKEYTSFTQLTLCNLFCSSSTDWGTYANPKKDTVIFGSPHYIVETSYRLYILTVCLIVRQVCKEYVLL